MDFFVTSFYPLFIIRCVTPLYVQNIIEQVQLRKSKKKFIFEKSHPQYTRKADIIIYVELHFYKLFYCVATLLILTI